jgi:hypothetical protein
METGMFGGINLNIMFNGNQLPLGTDTRVAYLDRKLGTKPASGVRGPWPLSVK